MYLLIKTVMCLLMTSFLISGCNKLPYEPFMGGREAVNDICSGLWVIDELSSEYLKESSYTNGSSILADEHFLWLFKNGHALVHCKRDFDDKTYRYRSFASEDAYRETCGATMTLESPVPDRFRQGAFGTWTIRSKSEVALDTGDLDHPSEWKWRVEISAGGHVYCLYIGMDPTGFYLAIPVYVDHYAHPRKFVRLRKHNFNDSIVNQSLHYPLASGDLTVDSVHLERLMEQLEVVVARGIGKTLQKAGQPPHVKYYIYDELFGKDHVFNATDNKECSFEGLTSLLLSTQVLRKFRDYVQMKYRDADIGVEYCPNVENLVHVRVGPHRIAVWITVTIPVSSIGHKNFR